MVRNTGVRKQSEEAQIDWMLQSETPTPLSFFRFVDASERSRSIQKYSKILMKTIYRKRNSDSLNSVLYKFNVWRIQKRLGDLEERENKELNGDKHSRNELRSS
ncbi:166_t:CDS:2 [Funneliformis geosporum]|nr:166_t:CDS:2 [Funneliformis geosporum]